MKRRTQKDLENYVAGFDAAVEEVERMVSEGKSASELRDYMLAAQFGVRMSLTHPLPESLR